MENRIFESFAQSRRVPALIGVPYDGSSSFLKGTAEAPLLIRQALFSSATNLWTEAMVDLGQTGMLEDVGDLSFQPGESVSEMIQGAITYLLNTYGLPLALGGDHSITYPILRAIRLVYPKLSVLQFDAHPDLYEEFDGNRYSHASPFARIMEERLADQLVQVGIRTMNRHQSEQADRFGVQVIDMATWVSGHRFALQAPTYISIDLDVLDPAFALGVSHREPGGLSVRDILTTIQALRVPVIGADLVEFNPRQDQTGLTATVCAKLVKEIAGKMLSHA